MKQGQLKDFLTFYQDKMKQKFYNCVINKKKTLVFGGTFFAYLLPLTLIVTYLTSHTNLLFLKDFFHFENLLMTNAYITLVATLFFDYKKENKFFTQLTEKAHEFDTLQMNKNSSYYMLEAFYHVKLIAMIYQLNSLKGITYNQQTTSTLIKHWEEIKQKKQENQNFTQREIKDLCLFIDKHYDFIYKYHSLSFKEVENIFFDMAECSLKTQALYHLNHLEKKTEENKKTLLKSLKL
jgi:hypothetical protein